MRTHSSVGAAILAAIDFRYPVVPIVRHHHENWEGSGYPDGLSGTEIPIGARILAVLDCFDALTSDRPYRARLAVDEAIAILSVRRPAMYDPLVVEVFMESHPNWPLERRRVRANQAFSAVDWRAAPRDARVTFLRRSTAISYLLSPYAYKSLA